MADLIWDAKKLVIQTFEQANVEQQTANCNPQAHAAKAAAAAQAGAPVTDRESLGDGGRVVAGESGGIQATTYGKLEEGCRQDMTLQLRV